VTSSDYPNILGIKTMEKVVVNKIKIGKRKEKEDK
jgi:hypothetical protein